MKMLRYIAVGVLFVMFVIGFAKYGRSETPLDQLNAINAEYKKQVDSEIQRRHELSLEERRIEVLGRLQGLSAPQVSITTNVSARSTGNIASPLLTNSNKLSSTVTDSTN